MNEVGIETRTGLLHRWSESLSNILGSTSHRTISNGSIPVVEQIGDTAGQIWQVLEGQGPTELGQLVKAIDAPDDLVVLAVGWLAREEKINIDSAPQGNIISLR